MIRTSILRTPLLLVLAAAACSGGSSDTGGITSGTFDILATEPQNGGRLFLNDPIRFDFSTPVNLSSATLDTVSFAVLDLNGNPVAEQPTGHFELDTRPGDTVSGRRLLFVPTLPTNDTFDNGGFRPGRTYLVQLIGGDRHNDAVLRDTSGNGLSNAQTFRFTTADGATPTQLFRNRVAGGPRRLPGAAGFSITPPPEPSGVPLNKFGSPAIEIRLTFNQALNPHSSNLPTSLDTNPVLRSGTDKGRVFLEYFDPETSLDTWIPADIDLEENGLTSATLVMRPVGVLPNSAQIRVIVESTMEDISGESNVANTAYARVVATFPTQPSYERQFDAVVEQFTDSDQIDFDAPFLEPQAEVGNGYLRSGFAFEGGSTQLEFDPTTPSVVLNTDFTQVVPKNGLPFNVSGGVFNFKNVRIQESVIVQGQGTRPMVWLVSGEFRVEGRLTVRGGDGARVDTLNSANFPTAGGVGVCSGGNGGQGSPSSTRRDPTGQAGAGPGQRPSGGGGPGRLDCTGCGGGSGGGGGSFATQGDPWYKVLRGQGSAFQQQEGLGGNGCSGSSGSSTRTLAGGAPGPRAFTDARGDNDFWGAGVDRNRQIRIRGELAAPIGGAGGGGGGDMSTDCNLNSTAFANDNKGGGGGGGGGVLVVKALGPIIVGPRGRIEADGGHGGGGEPAGSCDQGGGGGAGSGGMVILMSASRIEFNARGTGTLWRYADNEYTFPISADGGICRTGQYLPPDVQSKYPLSNTGPVLPANDYDARPLGGFGGMGVVQLMAPPGDPSGPNADGTNTVLDDNIVIRKNNVVTSGTEKQQLIAWRGYPNNLGTMVGDGNTPTNIGNNEGDIRPTPLLLPVPYNSITRARSKWIDLGAAQRRPIAAADGSARAIVDPTNTLWGPSFEFAAVADLPLEPLRNGYAEYTVTAGSARVAYPAVFPSPVNVLSATTGASYRGAAAHRIELASPDLGTEADRYSQYDAELINNAGTVLGSFRILQHTDRVMLVSAADGLLPAGVARCQVRAKFFKVLTDNVEGLGSTYVSAVPGRFVPLSNVRVGFAFHTNPDPTVTGQWRYPAGTEFAYDLTDPAVIEEIRTHGATFVQWDVQFNSTYKSHVDDVNPRPFGPTSPRPELRFLRLPFRF